MSITGVVESARRAACWRACLVVVSTLLAHAGAHARDVTTEPQPAGAAESAGLGDVNDHAAPREATLSEQIGAIDLQLASGEIDDALIRLRALGALHPEAHLVWRRLVHTLRLLDLFPDAAIAATHLESIAPREAEVPLVLAIARFREGDAEAARGWLTEAATRAPRNAAIPLASRGTRYRIDPSIVLTLDDDTATERLEEITRVDDRRSVAHALGGAAVAFTAGAVALPFVGILDGFACGRDPSSASLDCSGRFGGYVAGSVLAGAVALGLIVAAIAMHVIASGELDVWIRRLRSGATGLELAQW